MIVQLSAFTYMHSCNIKTNRTQRFKKSNTMEIFLPCNAVIINLPGLHDDIMVERNLLDESGQSKDDSGSLSTAVFLVALCLISLFFFGCFLM